MTIGMEFWQPFWSKVDRSGECWVWTGIRLKGYGRAGFGGRDRYAHRIAWELVRGPIADGLMVCHKCDNRPCVRPDHLFLGTARENIHDCIAKGRRAEQKRRAVRAPGEPPTREAR